MTVKMFLYGLESLTTILTQIGEGLLFLRHILVTAIRKPVERHIFFEQIYSVTMQSLLTTAASGFFVGAIMAVQFGVQLKQFGTISVLGGLATSGTVRELGPLLIAFMLSGKVGAYTSAELGTMRVTEQIDAMKCLGTDPIRYLIVPRFFAIVVSGFFLLMAGLLTSLVGGVLLGQLVDHISPAQYVGAIARFVSLGSVMNGLFKCFTFSVLLATICTFKGYTATGGAKGVGRTVINTALSTMVGIVLTDWFTSFIARSCATIMRWGNG